MSDIAYVSELPLCDFCKQSSSPHANTRKAKYDFRTVHGPWANGCEIHYRTHRAHTELGTGHGQRLVLGEPPERTDEDIMSDLQKALVEGDFDAMEEALGDRDFAEFM